MSVNDPPGSGPDLSACPAAGCEETEDLMVQECAPGRTWIFTGGVCGHVAFIAKKPTEIREEAS